MKGSLLLCGTKPLGDEAQRADRPFCTLRRGPKWSWNCLVSIMT